MDTDSLHLYQHTHVFGQDQIQAGERRTVWVLALTAGMMILEIATGLAFGSMALLADGLHMGSHASALGIAAFAYRYARRHAHNRDFTFGTGKVNALAGFSSATLLAVFALMMAWESIQRFFHPVAIRFNQAIFVAVIGLVVNAVSAVVLAGSDHEHQDHDHGVAEHAHADHNLRAAYLHVLADALTSLLAIFALLAGKLAGAGWMDPLMGIIGALLVSRWSWGLLQDTSAALLDRQPDRELEQAVVAAVEAGGSDRVADVHVWSIGPGIYAAALCVVSDEPKPPEWYKELLPEKVRSGHVTVEVQQCGHGRHR